MSGRESRSRLRGEVSRRALLGLGASAALCPFVPVLDTRASALALPRRLVILFSSNGTIGDAWDPSPGLELGPILQPLAAHKQRLLFLNNLRMECAFHSSAQAHAPAMNGCLTGAIAIPNGPGGEAAEHGLPGGASVDQIIAQRIGAETKFPSLELGAGSLAGVGDALGHLVSAGREQPLLPENDPRAAFQRLFGELDDPAHAQRVADRRSVLDLVAGDLQRLQGELGQDEQHKLAAHLQAVRELEQSLELGTGPLANAACQVPAPPQIPDAGPETLALEIPAIVRAQIELAVMALACDLTRIVTLDIGGGGSGLVHSWLGHTADHHTLAHDEFESAPQLIEINTWVAEQYAYLLDQLAAVPEGDGSVLDNTVVLWLNELATGNHLYDGLRVVMSGGGYFTPGRLVTLAGDAFEYNNLLVSLCHAMGQTDIMSVGEPEFCSGPLDALL